MVQCRPLLVLIRKSIANVAGEVDLAQTLPGYILRAVCPRFTLYLPVRHLLTTTCTRCTCEPIRANGAGSNAAAALGGAWSPVGVQAAEGWRFPAIYVGNATLPGLDRRWTSQAPLHHTPARHAV